MALTTAIEMAVRCPRCRLETPMGDGRCRGCDARYGRALNGREVVWALAKCPGCGELCDREDPSTELLERARSNGVREIHFPVMHRLRLVAESVPYDSICAGTWRYDPVNFRWLGED